ncbi:MAG: hypothetical protein HYV97_05465 [Bdellovibrio sp.]|nr:hypothetical protein [Bdellovibrio sp.]
MKTTMGLLLIILGWQSAWAEVIDILLPESEVFKAYDKCLIEQSDLWDKMMRNVVYPYYESEMGIRRVEEANFHAGFDAVVYNVIGADDNDKIELSFGAHNGTLAMRLLERDERSGTFMPKKIIGLQDVYLPFFKFYAEETNYEIVTHLGERSEHQIRLATRLRLFPSITNAPAAFINAKTGLPVLDREGNPLQLDSVKFADCLRQEVSKSSLQYAVTDLNHLNRERADYIKRMAKESRDTGIVFRGQSLSSTGMRSIDR